MPSQCENYLLKAINNNKLAMRILEFEQIYQMQRIYPERKLQRSTRKKKEMFVFYSKIQNQSVGIRRKNSFEPKPWETASSKVQLNTKKMLF